MFDFLKRKKGDEFEDVNLNTSEEFKPAFPEESDIDKGSIGKDIDVKDIQLLSTKVDLLTSKIDEIDKKIDEILEIAKENK